MEHLDRNEGLPESPLWPPESTQAARDVEEEAGDFPLRPCPKKVVRRFYGPGPQFWRTPKSGCCHVVLLPLTLSTILRFSARSNLLASALLCSVRFTIWGTQRSSASFLPTTVSMDEILICLYITHWGRVCPGNSPTTVSCSRTGTGTWTLPSITTTVFGPSFNGQK